MCRDPVNLRNRQARQNSETVVRAPLADGDRVNGVSKMVCSVFTGGPVWPLRIFPPPTRELLLGVLRDSVAVATKKARAKTLWQH